MPSPDHQQAIQDLGVLFQAAGLAALPRQQHQQIVNAGQRLGRYLDAQEHPVYEPVTADQTGEIHEDADE